MNNLRSLTKPCIWLLLNNTQSFLVTFGNTQSGASCVRNVAVMFGTLAAILQP